MDTYFVRRDDRGTVVCATCTDFPTPAAFVATYEKTDGSGRGAWALCKAHAPFGLIAWGALTPIADFDASQTAAVSTDKQVGIPASCRDEPKDPHQPTTPGEQGEGDHD